MIKDFNDKYSYYRIVWRTLMIITMVITMTIDFYEKICHSKGVVKMLKMMIYYNNLEKFQWFFLLLDNSHVCNSWR